MDCRLLRRILGFLTVVGFVITFANVPTGNWKWAVGGATASGIIILVIAERLINREERVSHRKDLRIAELEKRYEELAVYNDPELLEVFKEDQRERLRIEREAMELAQQSQQDVVHESRKQFLEQNKLLNDIVRKRYLDE